MMMVANNDNINCKKKAVPIHNIFFYGMERAEIKKDNIETEISEISGSLINSFKSRLNNLIKNNRSYQKILVS